MMRWRQLSKYDLRSILLARPKQILLAHVGSIILSIAWITTGFAFRSINLPLWPVIPLVIVYALTLILIISTLHSKYSWIIGCAIIVGMVIDAFDKLPYSSSNIVSTIAGVLLIVECVISVWRLFMICLRRQSFPVVLSP